MKKIIVLLALLVTSFSIGQTSKAKTLLNEVSSKVKSYKNISIDFKYVLDNKAEDIHQETRGNVIMAGENYRLNILGITRIFNGRQLYTISPEDEEVTISKETNDNSNTITPSAMLSFYEKGYNYKLDIVQNVMGRKIQYVKLSPTNIKAEVKYVLLGIDRATKHIYNVIEVGNNGTKTTLTVNSFKTNQTLSDSLFTFDNAKYSDYYINTLD